MSIIKKGILATTLAASALTASAPAMARDYYGHHDNTAAVAIGAGVVGLAIGAIAASDHHDRYRDYDDRYYRNDGYYRDGYRYDDRRRHRGDWDRRDHDRWDGNRYYSRRGY